MKRREFLGRSALWMGAASLGPAWVGQGRAGEPRTADEDLAGSPAEASVLWPDLALARGEPSATVPRVLEALGGMGRFLKPGQVVVVKPNVSFDCPPEWGATTDPGVLAAVLEACFLAGARRVLVVDHTMGQDGEACFRRNGAAEAVAAFPKAKLVSLDDEKGYVPVEVPGGKALKATMIPAVIQKADLFVNLPTAKSHNATGVSLGLKNLMGLVWDRHVFHTSLDLHQGIADLATILKPHLTILDAVRILKTGGPVGPGQVEEAGLVLAGVDPVAVDAYGAGLSTWNRKTYSPSQIGYITRAVEHGLGRMDVESLRIQDLG